MCAKDGPSLPVVSAAVFLSVITFVKDVLCFLGLHPFVPCVGPGRYRIGQFVFWLGGIKGY